MNWLLLFNPMPWTESGVFETLWCPLPDTILGNPYSVPLGQGFKTLRMNHKNWAPHWSLQIPRTTRWDLKSIIFSFPVLETHLEGSWEAEPLLEITKGSSLDSSSPLRQPLLNTLPALRLWFKCLVPSEPFADPLFFLFCVLLTPTTRVSWGMRLLLSK